MTLIRLALGLAALLPISQADAQVRARALGVAPGIFVPGAQNAITDVAGVRVGQVTLIEGDSVRTGITAILPHGGNLYVERVPAAIHVGNGFGKLLGSTQVDELGELESPVLLTCTLCVWRAADALVGWILAQPGDEIDPVGARPASPAPGRFQWGDVSPRATRGTRDAWPPRRVQTHSSE